MEAFQAGCEDYIDRQRPPAVIAAHIRNIVISKSEGFQPTQMLAQADTSLSGSLTHHDLPGVLQMLGHAHQTGALHINAGATDAILFFDAGNITHAECGNLFGDEAVIHIIKNCVEGGQGVYKFVYGSTSNQHTVLRNATDLMLDAMREYDESTRGSDGSTHASGSSDNSTIFASTEATPTFADTTPTPDVTASVMPEAAPNATSATFTEAEPFDSEPSLLHRLEDSYEATTHSDTESHATTPVENSDSQRLSTNETSTQAETNDYPTPTTFSESLETPATESEAPVSQTLASEPEHSIDSTYRSNETESAQPAEQQPLPTLHDEAPVSTLDFDATQTSIEYSLETQSAPPVAVALLPAPETESVSTHPSTEAASVSAAELSTDPNSDNFQVTPDAYATPTIKRRDLLKAELSSYPTTITDRILSGLRDHGSPVDQALAKLLSAQLSGNLDEDTTAEITPGEIEFTTDSQNSNQFAQQQNESDSHNEHQNQDQNSVHHSDDRNKELP
jgi:Domain of unknown function (DUF4388)